MEIKILFFGSLKEELGIEAQTLNLALPITAEKLKQHLAKLYPQVKFADDLICSVNQTFANGSTIINENDEVAFFPPVTGG